MAPIAFAPDYFGSLIHTSSRAGLYALKYTLGKISTKGVYPFSKFVDSVGPISKSPRDLATICDILTPLKGRSYHDCLNSSFQGLRIGFVDTFTWSLPPHIPPPNDGYPQHMTSSDSFIQCLVSTKYYVVFDVDN